jgi:hypothetical protein
LLRVLERAVAVHCVRTLAPGSRALLHAQDEPHVRETRVRSSDLGAPLDAPAQRALWGAWAGRELAYFEACGQIAGGLTWPASRRFGGAELALAIDVARDARRDHLHCRPEDGPLGASPSLRPTPTR